MTDRAAHLDGVHAANQEDAWGVWLIIGLTALFAALALVNATAMATAERRDELATIRLLGGTPRAGGADARARDGVDHGRGDRRGRGRSSAVAVAGVPRGVTGVALAVPGGLTAGARRAASPASGLAATVVAARLALRASPAAAMRVRG